MIFLKFVFLWFFSFVKKFGIPFSCKEEKRKEKKADIITFLFYVLKIVVEIVDPTHKVHILGVPLIITLCQWTLLLLFWIQNSSFC